MLGCSHQHQYHSESLSADRWSAQINSAFEQQNVYINWLHDRIDVVCIWIIVYQIFLARTSAYWNLLMTICLFHIILTWAVILKKFPANLFNSTWAAPRIDRFAINHLAFGSCWHRNFSFIPLFHSSLGASADEFKSKNWMNFLEFNLIPSSPAPPTQLRTHQGLMNTNKVLCRLMIYANRCRGAKFVEIIINYISRDFSHVGFSVASFWCEENSYWKLNIQA